MADKNTTLSITISTIDKATAHIKAISAELDKVTKPTRDLKKAFGGLAESSGLNKVTDAFKGVGSAIGDLLGKVAMVGGVAGVAVAGLIHISDEYEVLGKTAARLGVGADFLAGMRDAAERTGVPMEALDDNLDTFAVNLGKARAGAGRMAAFLPKISTNLHSDFGSVLLRQLKAAKGNAAAFDVLAEAMSKLKDPAERSALAMATVGDAKLAPLLQKGSKAIAEMRDHYTKLAPGQAEAADAAMKVGESMKDLHDATDGVKASLIIGLGPALKKIIVQLTEWLTGHQADVKQWATDIGEKLPGAVNKVVEAVKGAVSWVVSLVEKVGGLKTVAIVAAAILVGPLVAALATLGSAFVTLGIAVMASPIGLEIAAWTAAAVGFVAVLGKAVKAGQWLKEKAEYQRSVNDYSYEVKEGNPDLSDDEVMAQARKLAASAIGESRAREALQDRMDQEQIDGATPGVSAADVSGQARASLPDAWGQTQAQRDGSQVGFIKQLIALMPTNMTNRVVIDLQGAPKGTRVKADPANAGVVDFAVGYLMGF